MMLGISSVSWETWVVGVMCRIVTWYTTSVGCGRGMVKVLGGEWRIRNCDIVTVLELDLDLVKLWMNG
jgi:hypothetical protein